jgi:hypothetical protein
MDLNRRNLLRALGLAGPAYFLPSALTGASGGRAAAATPAIPTRILFFYTPHGTLFRQWIKAPAGAAVASETSFDLGPILQPLLPFKNKLLVLEGLDWQSEYVDTISASNAHLNGQTHALTAISRAGAGTAGGISIDQFIAQKLSAPTPLPSLEMSARWNSDVAPFLTSWTGSGALVPPMTRPDAVFSRLFPQGPPVTGTQPATDPAVAAAARRKRSILDGVLGEFNALSRPLSTADRAKMDAHAALIRDLEMRIGIAAPPPSVACSAPPQGPIQQFNKDCSSPGDICIEESTSLFSSLAVAAFACDLTRVITLDMDMLSSTLGVADMHAFLHGVDDVYWYANDRWGTPIASGSVPPTAMDPANIKIANAFYATYAQNLATLLQGLDAVIEPDGKTLLDHTIVVWCGEIGSPGHNNSMVNYVVAGGGAANIRGGRYVSMPRTSPAKPQNGFPNSGIPHNNLFVSLANAVGLSNVTTFGNPSICTGPLTQL